MVVDTSFKITYQGPITAIIKKRKWNNEVETPSWTAVGLLHKRAHLAKHFTESGASEYGYVTRSKKYTAAKLAKFGHSLPLVYTGELRQSIQRPEIRATSKGVKVVLSGSQKANLRPKGGRIRMADELRVISDAEAVRLAREKDNDIRKRLAHVRGGWTTLIH